ncbi:GNAT family N-acetyltransferase [Virgibacillus kekensis]|uniref:GNAT family N-acetyltransferase n=1 Tax=Virgibacillus kekensis TaxID=202261 RepID=A0ABV9DN73_9BACI
MPLEGFFQEGRRILGDYIISPFGEGEDELKAIADLYFVTFQEEDSSKQQALATIRKHTGYEGFVGFQAHHKDGMLAGVAYGYTSKPGQFYREKLAAQLPDEQAQRWLSDCFEFVELAVHPDYKRRGLASNLHDMLLGETGHKTAVLTTAVDNEPAIGLYAKKGWEVIKNDVPVLSEDNPQLIMGKYLNQTNIGLD